jgi:glutamate N-acetyltransferase / amino-acid N-acetyltransferase
MTDTLPVVRGFRFAGISAGIKKSGAKDLALLVADRPVPTAGVFTRNLVRAAPVLISEKRLAGGKARALLANSGNANACTGKEGHAAAIASSRAVARALGVDDESVLPSSTGVIGVVLPGGKLIHAAPALVADLAEDGAARFAEAIMTTDRFPKTAAQSFRGTRGEGTLLGIAKGAGMIHPNMATMLAFLMTDAPASPGFLKKALAHAAATSFNAISVDGDTSTNDTVLLMASGAVGGPEMADLGEAKGFLQALDKVCRELAWKIVRDGEGAIRVMEIEVTGARSERDAKLAAHAIGTSPLVKTALHGGDPNWGRILAALGRSGARFVPDNVSLDLGSLRVVDKGQPAAHREKDAARVFGKERVPLFVSLGKGPGRAVLLSCDFGHDYVALNADYRS